MEVTVMRFGKTSWDEGTIQTDSWADATATPSHTSRNTGNQGADQTQFEKIKKAIDNEYSDDNKLSVAKAIIKNNYIYTSQVKVIMNLFYDEDRKLAFAKYAYDYCVDTNNYFTLKEEFYSDTRKRSLMDFIGAR